MRMLYDHVLIKPLEKKTVVLIPDKQASVPHKGEVVSVGPGDAYGYPEPIQTTVKFMDKIYFSRDRAKEVTLGGKTFYVVKERDCLGVITDEEAKD